MRNRIVKSILVALLLVSVLSPIAQVTTKEKTLKPNDPAPTFFLKTLTGEDFFLSDYCGKPRQPWKQPQRKLVVLSFFATYCIPCLKEIPQLQESAAKWKEKAVFVLINLKEEPDKVRGFVAEHRITLPVLLDSYGVVAEKYNVEKLPSLFLIDKSGKVRYRQTGYEEGIGKLLDDKIGVLD